jgi:hypothetical protein
MAGEGDVQIVRVVEGPELDPGEIEVSLDHECDRDEAHEPQHCDDAGVQMGLQ